MEDETCRGIPYQGVLYLKVSRFVIVFISTASTPTPPSQINQLALSIYLPSLEYCSCFDLFTRSMISPAYLFLSPNGI
jgi:hypothetical protein